MWRRDSVEPSGAPHADEIYATGAPTLQHWHQVEVLTGQRRASIFAFALLGVICATTVFVSLVAYLRQEYDLCGAAHAAAIVSIAYTYWVSRFTYYGKRHRDRTAANKRGWFTGTEWHITADGVSYASDTVEGRHRGFSPWTRFCCTRATDSLVLLYYNYPWGYIVLAREWFASTEKWQQFLTLVARSVTTTVPGAEEDVA